MFLFNFPPTIFMYIPCYIWFTNMPLFGKLIQKSHPNVLKFQVWKEFIKRHPQPPQQTIISYSNVLCWCKTMVIGNWQHNWFNPPIIKSITLNFYTLSLLPFHLKSQKPPSVTRMWSEEISSWKQPPYYNNSINAIPYRTESENCTNWWWSWENMKGNFYSTFVTMSSQKSKWVET